MPGKNPFDIEFRESTEHKKKTTEDQL